MPRAEAAVALLKELNSDVVGMAIVDSLEAVLENSADFFSNFQLVIASSLPEKLLLRLANVLWENDVPLLICRSYGFVGYLRLVAKEHTIIESHPENALDDLRLDIPFDGLKELCASVELEKLTLKQHSHIPWLIILYKYLQQWKDSHQGQPPKNYKEKNELKDMIKRGRMMKEAGDYEDEENFDEAVRSVNTALLPTKVPSEVVDLFEDENCTNLNLESKPFWILVRALKEFVSKEGNGNLPLRGTIPDMTSDTQTYVRLQRAYKEQANVDTNNVSLHAHKLLQALGRDEPLHVKKSTNPSPTSSPARPEDCITEEDIAMFCKNAHYLRLFRTKPLSSDIETQDGSLPLQAFCMEDSDDDEIMYLVLLKCSDQFYSEYNRYPGSHDESLEDDFPLFKACVIRVCQEMGLPSTIKDDYIHEFCRQGASEIHSVASLMGGVAAQEAIKLITHQFTPINNTFLYNAMKQTSRTFSM